MHPRSSVFFILDTEIFVEAFTFSISIILLISKPEVMHEISHLLILMNDVHLYEIFIFSIFEIFCRIFLFPCVVSGFFLLMAQGKLLTAHAIGTPPKGSTILRSKIIST